MYNDYQNDRTSSFLFISERHLVVQFTGAMTFSARVLVPFRQWTNGRQAVGYIAKIAQEKGTGTHDVPLPSNSSSRVFLASGIQVKADMARVIVNPDGSVKTAYSFNSKHKTE